MVNTSITMPMPPFDNARLSVSDLRTTFGRWLPLSKSIWIHSRGRGGGWRRPPPPSSIWSFTLLEKKNSSSSKITEEQEHQSEEVIKKRHSNTEEIWISLAHQKPGYAAYPEKRDLITIVPLWLITIIPQWESRYLTSVWNFPKKLQRNIFPRKLQRNI